jgi:hypothetical protein
VKNPTLYPVYIIYIDQKCLLPEHQFFFQTTVKSAMGDLDLWSVTTCDSRPPNKGTDMCFQR